MVKATYIDADSLLYRASHLAQRPDDSLAEAEAIELDGEEEDIQLDTAEQGNHIVNMALTFHSMVNEIMKEVKADAKAKGYEVYPDPVLVITVKGKHEVCSDLSDNFRYSIMSGVEDEKVKGYKANRAGMEVPDGLNDIYEYVFGLENTICISGVEADDVCVHYGRLGHIVAALDKDVLGSLEYAYNYGRKEWVEHTPEEIDQFPYLQTIMGDSSDGLRGVFRVGAKGAEKALDGLVTHRDMWVAVVKQYALKDQSIEEALATMRCVRMDQWTPEAGLVLWTPPVKMPKVQTRAEVHSDMELMRANKELK